MNYSRIYNELVAKGKTRGSGCFSRLRKIKATLDGYYEIHHIVAKCLGGSNTAENLVLFTAEEHFIAHALLCKIHPNNLSLLRAFFLIRNGKNYKLKRFITRQEYSTFRESFAKLHAEATKGVPKSEEIKKRMSTAQKGKKQRPEVVAARAERNRGFKHSLETRAKMSKSQKGRKTSEKTKALLSKIFTGRIISEEQREKARIARTGQKRSEESKLKQSITSTGRKNSKETLNKMKISANKPEVKAKILAARLANPSGIKITDGINTWPNIVTLAKELGVNHMKLQRRIREKKKFKGVLYYKV